MSSGTRRRVAVVGTGAVAGEHARALTSLPQGVELTAAVDVDPGRAEAFAREWGMARTARSLDELLAVEHPDVVHICTPPGPHVSLAMDCLKAGVVPVIEKPPVMSLVEHDELLAVEQASSVSAACIFQHRFGSAAVRLRDWVRSGRLGRPLVAAAGTYWYRDDAYYQVPWRGSWELEGGGPTMGHGIHQFDLLLSVLGPWAEVTAIAGRQARDIETEDVSLALVRFESGAVASVANSVLSPRQASCLRFDFEHATAEVEHLYGYRDSDWVLTPAPGQDQLLQQWQQDGADGPSGHAAQLAAVYAALDAGSPTPVTLAEARQTTEFIAALYASAFTGRTVRRGELGPDDPFARRMGGGLAPWTRAREDR